MSDIFIQIIVAYVLLLAVYAWRLAGYRTRVRGNRRPASRIRCRRPCQRRQRPWPCAAGRWEWSCTCGAFGTGLIPLLVVAGVWRHVLRRIPLAYVPAMWSIVFPVGMYGAGSHELGTALNVPWLVTLGRDEAWAALAVWAVVAAAMIARLPGSTARSASKRFLT